MRPTKKQEAATAAELEKVVVSTSRSGIMTIPGVKVDTVRVLVIGTAPLICHKFSQKMIDAMSAKQQGTARGAREAKVPENQFNGARYRLRDGWDGIPAGGVKACIVAGARGESSTTMTGAKGAVLVRPDDKANNLVRILRPLDDNGNPLPPQMREDVCRNATGVADIRHRPEYWPWALELNIEILPSIVSANQILQMCAHAGRAEGLCEWRPASPKSKSGQMGTFRLASMSEIEAFENDTLFDLLAEQDAAEMGAMRIAAE